jgi:hypothetical protein
MSPTTSTIAAIAIAVTALASHVAGDVAFVYTIQRHGARYLLPVRLLWYCATR